MNERIVESIKVPFRKNKLLYKLAKVFYAPVSLVLFLRKKRRAIISAYKLVTTLKDLNPCSKRVFYFGFPVHENLGDAAQMYCIRKWINHHYPSYQRIEIESIPTMFAKVQKELERIILPENDFIIESGATFSNKHVDHPMHRYLLSRFKENRILFMPNTVNLHDQREMLKTAELFNNHPYSFFLARDPASFNMIKPYFNNKRISLCPDIVTSLIGNIDFNVERNGILVCKRIDGEKKYSDHDIKCLLEKLKRLSDVCITDTNFDNSIEYTYAHLEEEIINKLKLFSSYDVILTDRYHGMIFSLIANTPVVVLATLGHKVREGAQWLKEDYPNSIWYCNTCEEAYDKIKEIYERKIRIKNESKSKELYFDGLFSKFKLLTKSKG